MKIPSTLKPSAGGVRGRRRRGLTLPEMMVAMGVFSLVVLGVIQLHLFGLRQDQLVGSKLGASDQSRRSFNQLMTDIHSAKILRVGDGSQTTFTPIPNGQAQQGTALQIHRSTDTNSYIRYYYASAGNEMRRMETGRSGFTVVADHLTNNIFFRAENGDGSVVTDGTHNYVINILLQFYQYQYPLTRVGPGYYYDFYKLETKVTRRSHD